MNYCLKIDVEEIVANGSVVSKQEVAPREGIMREN